MSNPAGSFAQDNDSEHSEERIEFPVFIVDRIPEGPFRGSGSSGAGGGFKEGSVCNSDSDYAIKRFDSLWQHNSGNVKYDRKEFSELPTDSLFSDTSLNSEEEGTVVSNPLPEEGTVVSDKFNPVSQDALAISDDAINLSDSFCQLAQLISRNLKYGRKEFSELPTDTVAEVFTRVEPRTICPPEDRSSLWSWMITRKLPNVARGDGFLVSGISDGVGVTPNVDLYLDKELNIVDIMKHQGRVSMLGTSNGLVLFMMDDILEVMNPITRTKRSLPTPYSEFDHDVHQLYEFHYNESKKEYYILRIVQHREESYRTDVEMYSSSTDMWNVIQPPLPFLEKDMSMSFKIKPEFTCPIYHVNYPVKIGSRFYYITVDPGHSYYAAIISFNMEDYAFEFVKIFRAEAYRTSNVLQLGVSTDGILSLLMTIDELDMKLLTTFDSKGPIDSKGPTEWSRCSRTSLVPELLGKRLEQMGVVLNKLFPFTDSLCSVSLST